jgi:hypothetical protein
MCQYLFRCTCPTIGVLNAGGAVRGVSELLERDGGNAPQMIVGLDARADGMTPTELGNWVADATRLAQQSNSNLVLFDERLALAVGLPLPRHAGLTPISEHIAVVSRLWKFGEAVGRSCLTVVGPITEPSHARFHGSTWTHGLVSTDDVDQLLPTPNLIIDSLLPPRRPQQHSSSVPHPTHQLAWTILDRATPQAVWVRGAPDDVRVSSPTLIHRVPRGEIATVALTKGWGTG